MYHVYNKLLRIGLCSYGHRGSESRKSNCLQPWTCSRASKVRLVRRKKLTRMMDGKWILNAAYTDYRSVSMASDWNLAFPNRENMGQTISTNQDITSDMLPISIHVSANQELLYSISWVGSSLDLICVHEKRLAKSVSCAGYQSKN